MKMKKDEFEIEIIGEQTSLTQAEEKALSDYFKQKKERLKRVDRNNTVRKSNTATN